jgi:hypothetical protein
VAWRSSGRATRRPTSTASRSRSNYHSQTDSEQPGFSRDAIAEVEVVPIAFDATQGRSQGMIVNAVTRSGTNQFAGSFGGYFRDDKFNSEDFFTHTVLPYSNQQTSATFGGPIKKDRIHFFGSYGFEREPKTYSTRVPYPFFNLNQQFVTQNQHSHGTARLSVHAAKPAQRPRVRVQHDLLCRRRRDEPSVGGRHARAARPQYAGTFTPRAQHPFGQRNQSRRTQLRRLDQPSVRWKGGAFPYHPVGVGNRPVIQLAGYTIGANTLNIWQYTQNVRDDFTTTWNRGGRHDVKIGGEFFRFQADFRWCNRCMGEIDARNVNLTPAQLQCDVSPYGTTPRRGTWRRSPRRGRSSTPSPNTEATATTSFRNLFSGWAAGRLEDRQQTDADLGAADTTGTTTLREKLKLLPFLPGEPAARTDYHRGRRGIGCQRAYRRLRASSAGALRDCSSQFAPNDGRAAGRTR